MRTGQRLTAIVAALALVIAGGTAFFALTDRGGDSPVPSAQAQPLPEERGIRVDAEGQISVEPDTARVTVGIEVEGQEIGQLRETANTRMNDVIDSLTGEGIDEADIRTVAYDIHTVDDSRPPQPVPEDTEEDSDDGASDEPTYRLIQLLEVKVSDIDMTGDVIDLALDAGANRINGIRFEVEDRAGAIEQARERAVENARAKAEHLAQLTGMNLGAPLSIQERSPSLPAAGYDGAAAIEQEMAEADTAAPIQPGESTITVSVNIVYGIE